MPVRGEEEHNDSATGERAGAAVEEVSGAETPEPDGAAEEAPAQATATEEEHDGGEQLVERDERRAKMERLRAEGIDPYPHGSWMERRTPIKEVLAAHDPSQMQAGQHEQMRYHLAGRLVSRRGHGKTAFLDLRDLSGSIQIVIRADAIGRERVDRMVSLDIWALGRV